MEKKFPKMKFAGYACIAFAVLLTVLVVFGVTSYDRIDVTERLITTWSVTGVGLLFGNAGKRLGGHALANKNNEVLK